MSGLLVKSLAVGLDGFLSAGSLSFGVLLVTGVAKLACWSYIKGLGFYQAYAVVGVGASVQTSVGF